MYNVMAANYENDHEMWLDTSGSSCVGTAELTIFSFDIIDNTQYNDTFIFAYFLYICTLCNP